MATLISHILGIALQLTYMIGLPSLLRGIRISP